jgi:hypothetical protein
MAKSTTSSASPSALAHRLGAPGEASQGIATPEAMLALRDVFWSNVVRDMLNGLSVLSQQQPELFDGRFAVLTHQGERIPIAGVTPIFACSIPGSREERDASAAVQCTVFRIQTPGGEVFTLPIQQIRGLHTMTPELLEQLQRAAGEDGPESEDGAPARGGGKPFGFAAFSALPKHALEPAPEQPME